MHTALQIWQTKSESIWRLSYEISARMKGTTLPILVQVLTSIDYWKAWFLTLCSSLHMRNKQQKLVQEKLLHKPGPFELSVSCNLKLNKVVHMLKQGCAHARKTYEKVVRVCKQFQFLGPEKLSTTLWQPCTKVVYKVVTSMNNLGISIRDIGCSCTSEAIE